MTEHIEKQRLVLFCSELDADLEKVRQALADVGDQHALGELELSRVEGPETLSHGGWMSLSVTRLDEAGGDLTRVGSHLEELVQSLSRSLSEDVLGVFVDPGSAFGRACLQSPGGFPRSSEGELFHVLRQTANWVEADPVQILRYFSAELGRGGLAAPVDLSDVHMSSDEKDVEPEMDDDDRFVEVKLKQARALMERYLSARK
jgi:hypothetical protein